MFINNYYLLYGQLHILLLSLIVFLSCTLKNKWIVKFLNSIVLFCFLGIVYACSNEPRLYLENLEIPVSTLFIFFFWTTQFLKSELNANVRKLVSVFFLLFFTDAVHMYFCHLSIEKYKNESNIDLLDDNFNYYSLFFENDTTLIRKEAVPKIHKVIGNITQDSVFTYKISQHVYFQPYFSLYKYDGNEYSIYKKFLSNYRVGFHSKEYYEYKD